MARKTEIIYGIHAVEHVFKRSPEDVLELWLLDSRKPSKEINGIKNLAETSGMNLQIISKPALENITGDVVHQGVAIRRRTRVHNIDDLDALLDQSGDSVPLLLILDGIQDPHNLGACLRTADAAGANAVVIPKDRAVSVNATVRKIASGAAEHTPVIQVTNLARTLEQLQQRAIWCYGLAEDAENSLFETDLTVPVALVLGGEGKGLRHNTRKHCDQLVHIPMVGQVESLNVSVTAAVCLYETVRQRSRK